MALINCPECNKQLSDKASACPNCGCPLTEMKMGGVVKIKLPNDLTPGLTGLIWKSNAYIVDEDGNELWKGNHGDTTNFTIDEPITITIHLGKMANPVTGIVEPRKRYNLVQDRQVHWLATYRINEVDVIDAD